MKKIEKNFDCVAMKRAAALRIYEETRDMNEEEELAYWRHKSEEARQKFPRMRTLDQAVSPPR